MTVEFIHGEFELSNRLKSLEQRIVSEKKYLLPLTKSAGIDLGDNPKHRINYLISLGILRQPVPQQDGRGLGGTRLFQRDAFEILEWVDSQSRQYAFNDIAINLKEKREDLVKKACGELDIASLPIDTAAFIKAARDYANFYCLFSYKFILAAVLDMIMSQVHGLLSKMEIEIEALAKFERHAEAVLPESYLPVVTDYLKAQRLERDRLLAIQERNVAKGKALLDELEEG